MLQKEGAIKEGIMQGTVPELGISVYPCHHELIEGLSRPNPETFWGIENV
jgi:hypothetical protein